MSYDSYGEADWGGGIANILLSLGLLVSGLQKKLAIDPKRSMEADAVPFSRNSCFRMAPFHLPIPLWDPCLDTKYQDYRLRFLKIVSTGI